MKLFYYVTFTCLVFITVFIAKKENTELFISILSSDSASWYETQSSRQKTLLQSCNSNIISSNQEVLPERFTYFVEANLLWCRVFKAGTTTWLMTYFDLIANKTGQGPILKHFKISNIQTFNNILKAQPVSFAVVRHPFSRLVSAYQDKGVGGEYPELRNKTFAQFLNLVIQQADSCASTNTWDKMDLHWRPYDKICSFCQVNYTVIAKLETFDQDREMILGMVGVHGERGGLEQVPGVDLDIKACRVTRQHFRGVSLKIKDKLTKIYHLDLKMFGYDPYLFD